MITLALFRKIAEDGVAGLVEDDNFFWEEVPLQHDGEPASGVWLVTRPGNISNSRKGLNLRTTVDIYVALENKARTEAVHQAIRQYLTHNRCFCQLTGEASGIKYAYENIRVQPATSSQNEGATENGMIVKVASVDLVYDESPALPDPPPLENALTINTELGMCLATEDNRLLITEGL